MARIMTPEEIRKAKRTAIIWIEYYDGELGRSTVMFAAMKCKDGSLVDEDGSIYTMFEKDILPDADDSCWRFWNGKPTAKERKETKWDHEKV